MIRVVPFLVAVSLLSACASDGGDEGGAETLPGLSELSTPETLPGSTAPAGTDPASAPTGQDGAPAASTATSSQGTTAVGPPEIALAEAVGGEGLVKVAAGASGRTYAVAKRGMVLLLTEAAPLTVLDISADVSTASEQGLLGLAVHPSLPLAYLNYTDTSGDTVITEYRVAPDGTFDQASARVVMEVDQPYDNHNGGNLVFGPDDYLYIGLGDGGSADDPERRALNLSTPLGKLLRIDPVSSDGFEVPADNPFIGTAGALGEIWSIGLRNPWRYSFDPPTGDLWIADVGQGRVEEVDVARSSGGVAAGKGVSFGWSAFEGDDRFNEDQPAEGHAPPYYTYVHEDGRCSITGGVVYRGDKVPELDGWYVFADYCSGEVWAFDTEAAAAPGVVEVVPLATVPSPTSIDQVGETLYVVSATDGALRVTAAG